MSRKRQSFTTKYATNCSFGEGGESSNCPSTTMTSKKMVLGGILAFFMSMLLVFSVGLLTGNLFDRSGNKEQSIALTEGDYWINYVTGTTGFAGGSGTEEDPYLIETAEQLAYLSYMVYSGSAPVTSTYYYYSGVYFKQTANIDLSAHYWQPIGIAYDRNNNSLSHYFSGNYDGGGFTISGIYTQYGTTEAYSYQGLFGEVRGNESNYLEFKNIKIVKSNIQGNENVGGLAGLMFYANVTNCSNYASINAYGDAAGLITETGYMEINNCSNHGQIVAGGSCAGIAYNFHYDTKIKNCFNTGDITSSGNKVAGIAGYEFNNIEIIENCYNTGDITVNYNNSSYNSTLIVGGIAGDVQIINSYNSGNINVTVSGNVTAYVGGISGKAAVRTCYNEGQIWVQGNAYVGGITGSGAPGYSYNIGEIITTDALYVGGITGSGNPAASYNRGNISNTSTNSNTVYVGGVAGNGKPDQCYNTGEVKNICNGTGSNYVAGISGMGAPIDSFNLGKVTATGSGTNNISAITANGSPTNCYFGGECTLEGFTENLENDVKDINWYKTNLPNWDFNFKWQIDALQNDGYPIIKSSDEWDWWLADGKYDTNWEGSGTKFDPYLIENAADLAGLSAMIYYEQIKADFTAVLYKGFYSGVYFKQTADIDLSAHYWQPVGFYINFIGDKGFYGFAGIYDGGGYTISGINPIIFNSEYADYCKGLFGMVVGSGEVYAQIKNVGVVNSQIEGNGYCAGIVGISAGNVIIENCYNEANVVSNDSSVGGILGSGSAFIYNCYNVGDITTSGGGATSISPGIGGLVGDLSGKTSIIANSYNLGTVTNNGDYYCGGLVGKTDSGTQIINSFNLGGVFDYSNYSGAYGICDGNYGTIINCYNLGELFATNNNTIGITSRQATNCFYGGNCEPSLGGLSTGDVEGQAEFLQDLTFDLFKSIDWFKNEGAWNQDYPWDFVCVWDLNSATNQGYPILQQLDFWLSNRNYVDTEWKGNGTKISPYLIEDAADLAGIAYMVNTKQGENCKVDSETGAISFYSGVYFKQTKDIDLSQHLWDAIGYFTNDEITAFSGVYDGQGFIISGVYRPLTELYNVLYQSESNCVALFGVVIGLTETSSSGTLMAEIKNINVKDSQIISTFFGANIVGMAYHTKVSNCVNYSDIWVNKVCDGIYGGVIAASYFSKVNDCYNHGDIFTKGLNLGGVIGTVINSSIVNCYNTGNIYGSEVDGVGGIIGFLQALENGNSNENDGVFSCENAGNIVGNNQCGGIIGSLYVSNDLTYKIENCYNYGKISGQKNIAGILGFVEGSSSANLILNGCYNDGMVEAGNDSVGGIIGQSLLETDFINGGNFGNITGMNYVGGVIGNINANKLSLSNIFVFSNIQGLNYVSGFIGVSTASNIIISTSLFEGNLSASLTSGDLYLGGMIAYASNCSNLHIKGSLLKTNVNSDNSSMYASGVVGYVAMLSLTDPFVIETSAIILNLNCSVTGGELANCRLFYFSPNIVDTDIITNSYGVMNSILTITDTTDGMDGAFGYLDNFQGGLPVPLGLYYITDYATTTGIVQQLQSLGF